MPSKTTNKKRATLPRSLGFTKDFLADWERYAKTGRYDLSKLKQVMLLLVANDEPLGAEWKDHELKGDWKGHRELHIGGDFLLIYTLQTTAKFETLVFTRIGTHSELFD